MAYCTSIGYATGIWNTEEHLEIFQGIPEIDRRKPPNNERVNERKPNTQRTTRRKEHGTQERNKEGTRNDRKTPFQSSKPSLQHGVPILEVRRLEVRRERNS
jgi:hypothetical protein